MSNPMLEPQLLPAFSQIKPDQIEAAIDQLLTESRETVERILQEIKTPTWDSLVAPLEEMNDRLAKAWSPVSHMNSVVNSDELRDAYNACIPKLSQYWTEMGQHQGLYNAFKQVAEGPEFSRLSEARQKVVNNTLRDFRLSGIALNAEDQQRYAELQQKTV